MSRMLWGLAALALVACGDDESVTMCGTTVCSTGQMCCTGCSGNHFCAESCPSLDMCVMDAGGGGEDAGPAAEDAGGGDDDAGPAEEDAGTDAGGDTDAGTDAGEPDPDAG